MKKMMMTLVALAFVLMAGAQGVKIAPKMEKGMKKSYTTEVTINIPGQKDVKMQNVTEYVVSDVASDGYTLSITTTDVQSDAAVDDMAAMLMTFSEQMLKGTTLKLKTDVDGKVVAVANYDEVQQKMMDGAEALLKKLYTDNPSMEQMAPREALMAQLTGNLTEQALLESVKNATSVVCLNGKTVMTGAAEDYTASQVLKMKRTYLLTKKDGSTITTSARLNMTKDELKQMVIDEVSASLPADQVEAVKQNIDMVMGQMTFDATETATYEMMPDKWVKTLTVNSVIEMMGRKVNTNTRVSLKE